MKHKTSVRILIFSAMLILISLLCVLRIGHVNQRVPRRLQNSAKMNEMAYLEDDEYSIEGTEVGITVTSVQQSTIMDLLPTSASEKKATHPEALQGLIDAGYESAIISVKVLNNTRRTVEVPCYKLKLASENWGTFIDPTLYSILNNTDGLTLKLPPNSEEIVSLPYIMPPALITSIDEHYGSSKIPLWLVLSLFPVKTTIPIDSKPLFRG